MFVTRIFKKFTDLRYNFNNTVKEVEGKTHLNVFNKYYFDL